MKERRKYFRKGLLFALLGVLFAAALTAGALLAPERSELPVMAQAAAPSPAHTDCEGGHVGWTPITSDGGALGGGNYYLTEDVTLTENITLNGDVNLCLNGYKLTGNGNGRVITVNSGPVNMYDCQTASEDPKHKHEYSVDEQTGRYDFSKTGGGVITGGVITGGNANEGGGLYVPDKTFNMYGGTIAGNSASGNGGGVYVGAHYATSRMYGVTIAGNTATEAGGGVCAGLKAMSVFFENCAIKDNTVTGNGGGVYLDYHSGVTYTNCAITGNKATGNGGGVYLDYQSGATYTNCAITGNTATGNGGGMYGMDGSGTLDGGEITGNTAANGGALFFVRESGFSHSFTLNDGTISDNTTTAAEGFGMVFNSVALYVYGGTLCENVQLGGTFQMYGGTFTGDTMVSGRFDLFDGTINGHLTAIDPFCVRGGTINGGVTHNGGGGAFDMTGGTIVGVGGDAILVTNGDAKIYNGDNGTIPQVAGTIKKSGGTMLIYGGYFDETAKNSIAADWLAAGLSLAERQDSTDPTYRYEAHGETHRHDNVFFSRPLPTSGGTVTPNQYVLMEDITTSAQITIGSWKEVWICLNGHSITKANYGAVINVDGYGTLHLYDCKGTGKITHSDGLTGSGVSCLGELNMYGGTITGNSAENGGGVNLTGTFNMNGGTITGNTATGNGGGVYATGGGKFDLNNGTISNNKATNGGGVFHNSDEWSAFNMKNGAITGNRATGNGGGVCLEGDSPIKFNNVTLESNLANGLGNGMYIDKTKQSATVQNGAVIRDNAYVTKGNFRIHGGTFNGDLTFANGAFEMINGTLNGNVTFTDGTFNMTGGYLGGTWSGTVTQNCSFTGGYFSATAYESLIQSELQLTSSYVFVQIDETKGDPNYKADFPYAIYTRVTTNVTGTPSQTTRYDGAPIAAGTDFTLDGLGGSTNVPTYSWVRTDGKVETGEGLPTNAGTYEITITFEAYIDYVNRKEYTGSSNPMTITIYKAQVNKPWTASNLKYNGTEQTGVADGDLYSVENGKGTNATNYVATVTLKDPDNYEWKPGFGGEIEWSIAPYTPTAWDFTFVGVGGEYEVEYDGNPKQATVTKKESLGFDVGEITYTYVPKKAKLVNGLPVYADEYTVKIKVAGNANVDLAENLTGDGWTFWINKRVLTIEGTKLAYTEREYDGTRNVDIIIGTVGNIAKADVGKDFKLTARGEAAYNEVWGWPTDVYVGYSFADDVDPFIKANYSRPDSDYFSEALTITPMEVAFAWDTTEREREYDGTSFALEGSANGVDDWPIYIFYTYQKSDGSEPSELAPVDAGTYTVTAESADPNYLLTGATVEFTITPKTVSLTWDWDNCDAVYSGSAKSLKATAGDLIAADEGKVDVSVEYLDGDRVNVTSAGLRFEAVGLTGESASNYQLPEIVESGKFTITPYNISGANVVLGKALTYSGAAQAQTVASVTLNGAALATKDYEVKNNVQTNAGTGYQLTVEGTGNYTGSVQVAFSITPYTLKAEDFSFAGVGGVYDGTVKQATVTKLVGFEVGEITLIYVPTAAQLVNGLPVNADTYTVLIDVAGNGNVNAADDLTHADWTFVIGKATYDMSAITFADGTFVENGGAHSLAIAGTLPAGVTVSYVGNGVSVVGRHTVTAVFAGDYANYLPIPDMTATLIVRHASLTQNTAEGDKAQVTVSSAEGISPETQLVVTHGNATPDAVLAQIKRTEGHYGTVDVSLMVNGESVQPEGELVIRLLIPDEAVGKSFRILHLHGEEVTEMEYTIEGDYAVISTSQLSSFTFVTDETGSALWLILVLAGLLVAEIVLIVLKKRKDKRVLMASAMFGGVLPIADIVLLAVLGTLVLLLGGYTVWLYTRKPKAKGVADNAADPTDTENS